jgi:lipoate---protein ligase
MIEIIEDKPLDAHRHMEIDRALVMNGSPLPRLRIYEWSAPAITAGLFSEPERLLNLEGCKAAKMDVVRRPTGGGILFHNKDLVCAFFIPNASAITQVCQEINDRLRTALAPYLPALKSVPCIPDTGASRFCMAQTAALDLIWEGRKIGGCAQRKTRAGILHHVSLFLARPDWETIVSCLLNPRDLPSMQAASTSFEELTCHDIDRQTIRKSIVKEFSL